MRMFEELDHVAMFGALSKLEACEKAYQAAMDEAGKEIAELKSQLHQQRFNNQHNLSIDQKVADEIEALKKKHCQCTTDLVNREAMIGMLKDDLEWILKALTETHQHEFEEEINDLRRKYGMEG